MIRALQTVWGLFFDDARLVVTLMISLSIAAALSALGYSTWAAFMIWFGLLLSLFVSIEHQLSAWMIRAQSSSPSGNKKLRSNSK